MSGSGSRRPPARVVAVAAGVVVLLAAVVVGIWMLRPGVERPAAVARPPAEPLRAERPAEPAGATVPGAAQAVVPRLTRAKHAPPIAPGTTAPTPVDEAVPAPLPREPAPLLPPPDVPPAFRIPEMPRWSQPPVARGGIDGAAVLQQSLFFLGIAHGYRLSEEKTREQLKQAKFFEDWWACIKNLDHWSDGGKWFTNYVAHPLQGSVSGRILLQNDAGAKAITFNQDGYWKSRMQAMGFAFLYGLQFEIGPISEATLGLNPEKEGLEDLVITPAVGTAFLVGEDVVDRYAIQAIEERTANKYAIRLSRMVMNPTRMFANLLRFHKPWHRDDRGLMDMYRLRNELMPPLSPEDERLLAEWYAPRLLFSGSEEYFPCSPLFPLDEADPDWDQRTPDRESAVGTLGPASARAERYRSLDLEAKGRLGTVYYQAYPWLRGGEPRVVIEYWLYYVHNSYRARGGVLPFASDLSHPNDLEHIFVVLKPSPSAAVGSTGFDIETVAANAHDESVPNNVLRVGDGAVPRHISFLVERGSHAGAPDIDEDGLFTPGVDSGRGEVVWGIRDRGQTWAWYPRGAMDRRRGPDVVVARAEGDERPETGERNFTYKLQPVARLSAQLDALALSDAEKEQLFRQHVSWVKRFFGKSDGGSEALVDPRRHEDHGRPGRMLRDVVTAERGVSFGTTNLADEHPIELSGRYSFAARQRYIPRVLVDASAMLALPDRPIFGAELLGAYPIDATTKVIFGGGVLSDPTGTERTQFDAIAGLEFTYGRLRFRACYRTPGPVNDNTIGFRASYVLWK